MRRVHRDALSEKAMALLRKRTLTIAEAGAKGTTPDKESSRLWKQEKAPEFEEIAETLKRMAPGEDLCMYCAAIPGSGIDHFRPRERYPDQTYDWRNYLWSCSDCNSKYKGSKFPLDEHGAAMLIDPTEDEPSVHLDLTPTTGKLVARTVRGEKTIDVLGFAVRGRLDGARRDAWLGIPVLLTEFTARCARKDAVGALAMQRTICRLPFACALRWMLDLLATPRGAELVPPAVLAAVEAYPEIRDWP